MPPDATDTQLLHSFARLHDQAAFALIVHRYAALVYSAALRQVGPALAEDVSQAVFLILAQKAGQIDGSTLAGWLVKTARYAALASRRMEVRLKQREQKAARMQPELTNSDDDSTKWQQLAPLLDEALARLDEKERSAITLRYLQGKSVREVAAAMSVSEAAAGKRATRAVQTLRDFFARRGVTLTTEALSGALAVHGVVSVPASLAGKLAATGVGGAAVSTGVGSIVKGTSALMLTAKTKLTLAAAALLVIGGGGVAIVATQFSGGSSSAAAPAAPESVQVIQAKIGVAPATQTIALTTRPAESFTRYATPAGSSATFSGRVEGVIDPAAAEVGIIALRGVQWTSNANYQWEPLNADGTFTIAAAAFPEASRALAVRSKGQSVTFVRATFEPGDSARDVVIHMKQTRPISIIATDSAGTPVNSFKVEIFDGSADGEFLLDDQGNRLSTQRLDAPLTSRGLIEVNVPLEPLCVMVSGTGIAPFFQKIDPRTDDKFSFHLLKATPIAVTITDGGKPVANERVMLNNPAVHFSYTARKTDAAGHFVLPAGIPGTYRIALRNKVVETQVIEGVPCEVEIDLAKLPAAPSATAPTTIPSGN